jgi:hypothetical protein
VPKLSLEHSCFKCCCLLIILTAILSGCGGGSRAVSAASSAFPDAQSSVQVSAPVNNSTVGTSVTYVAAAKTTCSGGIAAMGVFTSPGMLAYKANGASLNTILSFNPGIYTTSVEAWDNCGGTSSVPIKITVSTAPATGGPGPTPSGTTFANLEQKAGWTGYALLPPSYAICSSCSPNGPQTTFSMNQSISSPSLSGSSSEFSIGGTTQFSDVLWNNHLIGDGSSQGQPDTSHTLNPATHNFVYEVYFYGDNLSASQALEFDLNQFVNGKSFIWGHECRIAGGNEWDIWDNVGQAWHPTGIACNPINKAWNHLTIEVQRTSDDQLLFESITLNGNKTALNYSESPSSSTWYGITINYQMDGDASQQPYSIWLDNLNFTYW